MSTLDAIKISESVYWVGAIDWNVRNFHGYRTGRGTTYNAFLILSDKITLIDTVKTGFFKEMKARIASLIDPEKIDYIVSNHAEPDHSGELVEAIECFKPEKVFASKMGVKALTQHYNFPMDITAVADNEVIDLGNKSLTCIETRMLHWPDSMFTYLNEEKVLFTQDAFGMHLASSERFGDELPWTTLERWAKSYYANIITLYSPHVKRLIEKVEQSGLDFKIVAPDHGPVWRNTGNFSKLLGLYKKWSNRTQDKKVVVLYDTMWKATETMSRYFEDGLRKGGVQVVSMSMTHCDRSEVADELLEAAGVVVGSPTLNNNLLPSIADILVYMRGLKFSIPYSAVFGSYGWSGESVKQVKEKLEDMGTEVVGEVKCQYTPDEDVLKKCYEIGLELAEKVNTIN